MSAYKTRIPRRRGLTRRIVFQDFEGPEDHVVQLLRRSHERGHDITKVVHAISGVPEHVIVVPERVQGPCPVQSGQKDLDDGKRDVEGVELPYCDVRGGKDPVGDGMK